MMKKYLFILYKMTFAGIITTAVYQVSNAIFRALIGDMTEAMTASRSLLAAITMLLFQILYCFVLSWLLYRNTADGIKRLTDDCTAKTYPGFLSDMKKLIHKERKVLFTALALLTLSVIRFFLMINGVIQFICDTIFMGITGASVWFFDFFVFLHLHDDPATFLGTVVFSGVLSLVLGFLIFSIIYLFFLTLKRKKWYEEWKINVE